MTGNVWSGTVDENSSWPIELGIANGGHQIGPGDHQNKISQHCSGNSTLSKKPLHDSIVLSTGDDDRAMGVSLAEGRHCGFHCDQLLPSLSKLTQLLEQRHSTIYPLPFKHHEIDDNCKRVFFSFDLFDFTPVSFVLYVLVAATFVVVFLLLSELTLLTHFSVKNNSTIEN